MPDKFTTQERSRIMSRVKNRDTAPEKLVRKLLHKMGYRFRLQRKDLPGKPDIVLPKYKKVIFVHGCFWHGHAGCSRSARPTSNVDFWNQKIDKNISRDTNTQAELRKLGWQSLVVWQCQTRNLADLQQQLQDFLADRKAEDIWAREIGSDHI
jgi:DNA mismatch endonuclease (patch repair protein)